MIRYSVPSETLREQARAADPKNSAWVSANAGAGKTHVLAQRVVRLLLDGTDPSRILCLTYTRAAAANMATRVFGNLSRWSLLPDAELADEIERLEGRQPGTERLRHARRLFAAALETPGGLKIQTIHAFCEAILHQFPLEANVAGHFELLDAGMEQALLAETRRDLLAGATAGHDRRLTAAFADVVANRGEFGLDTLIGEIVAKRESLRRFLVQVDDERLPFPALAEEFGFDLAETAASIANACWPLPGFSPAEFEDFAAEAEAADARAVLKDILPHARRAFAQNDPVRRIEFLDKGFLKGDGGPYAQKTFKKALCDALPGLYERYLEAAELIIATADRLRLFLMLETTCSALVIADRFITRYEHLKRARGFLDFNDLIEKTVALLARADVGPWVQYKLDKGIDHILIDEAQDTSPGQWGIVRMLAEEFLAGQGARDGVPRTVFAVGDEKQSIYSFQGADPAAFAENRVLFDARVTDAGGRFEAVRLRHSFRSTEDVLGAVDRVFARPEVREGITRDPEPIDHKAIRAGAPGYVELWSNLTPETVNEPEDWREAVDHASAPAVRLAETIAGTIQSWLDGGERLEGKDGRKLTPGDVLVLVRKRDRFVHALSRSLKNRDIPVAGADRLRLTDHIAVKDLLALGRFIMQPHDDLSLAALLRSPLFDVSEERLFELAARRGDRPLFDALRAAVGSDPAMAEIVAALEEWRNAAAFRPVFEFYAGVLAGSPRRAGARRLFIARLGHEANDILDEFLGFCLSSEKAGIVGLEAFLATLEGAAPEIKREMDQTRGEVRIMTVHAAKGLEAPVVFLVDPGSAPFVDQHLPRLMPFESDKNGWQGTGYLWRAGKDVANEASRRLEAAERKKGEDEYRRLLYVGMTRAEDRLIVCGYTGLRPSTGLTWHTIVSEALAGAAETETRGEPEACAPVYRFRTTPVPAVAAGQGGEAPTKAEAGTLPAFLAPLGPPRDLPRPLSPSGASAIIEAAAERHPSPLSPVLAGETGPSFAIERGLAIHRMLQVLPGMEPAERAAAAARYLARAGAAWPEPERDDAWRSVEAILSDARFGPLFAPGSRAEVALMGRLEIGGGERAVSGVVDRLVVTPEDVLIVDYKTNRPAPETLAEVPDGYVAQLALYAELLKPLYPGRTVECALLFTEAPRLIAVPAEAREHTLAVLKQA